MNSVLSYKLFNFTKGTSPRWFKYGELNEGIRFTPGNDDIDTNMSIDWNNDTPEDVVKLAKVKHINPSKMDGMFTFGGYVLDDNGSERGKDIKLKFAEWSKKEDSLSDAELKSLIDYTYPQKLKEQQISILFAMGSSSPLSYRIASALKELYYPKAEIIDIMKEYYGIDPRDTIDWDAYNKYRREYLEKHGVEEPTRKKEVASYLSTASGHDARAGQFQYQNIEDFDDPDELDAYVASLDAEENRLSSIENRKFKGHIKKGGTARSGIFRDKLLKPGHSIDTSITDTIIKVLDKWKEDRLTLNPNMAVRYSPKFLTVDDVIVRGSTIIRAMGILRSKIEEDPRTSTSDVEQFYRSMYGYVLFSFSNRFTRRRDED
jgi:hypothetical protein